MGSAYYRVRLRLHSPIATPLHSGTIFGHLCWAWRGLESEESLETWLHELPDDPLLLSDAFPMDFLPRPILAPEKRAGRLSLGEIEQSKPLRKRPFLSKDLFLRLRGEMSESMLLFSLLRDPETSPLRRVRQAHNQIDRLSGSTPETGGLYFTEEEWPESESYYADVYVKTGLSVKQLTALFRVTGEWGYGKDATNGRGRWDAEVSPENSQLFELSGGRLMSLSHGSLTANMRDARYKLQVHYGKTGNVYAMSSSPFKYPMTLMRPGATFANEGGGPFGELLSDVHPQKPWVRHHAWHLPVAYTEAV